MSSNTELIIQYLKRVSAKRDLKKLAFTSQEGVESAESSDQRRLAAAGMDEIQASRLPSPEQVAGIEAIILPKIRPVLDVLGGDFHTDHPLWLKLNTDAVIRERLHRAIASVGRIELPGNRDYPYGGTGFIVGDELIMTNRHVAEIFSQGLGTRSLSFRPDFQAGINLLRELHGLPGETLMVKRIVMIHPYWDMALLAVEGLPAGAHPLELSLADIPADARHEVAAIGYPAFDPRNDTQVQNDLFHDVFGVKRLQPGTLGGREQTSSFGKNVAAVKHDCSTLGGNSGSALVDLTSGEVVALHFGGLYQITNWGVPTCELARDPRVFDAGVKFAGETSLVDPRVYPPWQSWWVQTDEAATGNDRPGVSVPASPVIQSPVTVQSTPAMTSGVSLNVSISLRFTVSVNSGSVVISLRPRPDAGPAATEAMVAPWHDTRYGDRAGYDPNFLTADFKIPMPTPADPDVVAKVQGSDSPVLNYQNFSITMHAERRLALITASNVTAEAKLKRPESGRDYTRKGLSGLGKNDQEQWFSDSRLDDKYQLSDVFYTKDGGAFDKGHIVRREDVAWGKTYDELRKANGDSYHITNCSPQVADFNRSNLGDGDNWGSLENAVLSGASSERYCQFAGPILDPDDRIFIGSGGRGIRLQVKTPSRFWKVIVALTGQGVASYGFVLEQDLSNTQLEFVVPAVFVKYMEPLKDIQLKAGVQFAPIVINADQYGTNWGEEIAFRAGAKRRSDAAQ